MIIKRSAILSLEIVILSFLFIFGIMTQGQAGSVYSLNKLVNQETMMKMDENKGGLQKKKSHAKEAVKSSKKNQARSQFNMQQTDEGTVMSRSKLDMNFLKAVKEKKKSLMTDFLDKVIFSYNFAQNAWMNHFPSFMGVAEAKSSDPNVSQSILSSFSTGSRYREEGRITETIKFPQFKKENISKEIFMGFRFSFNPVSGYLFLEMNAIPSEKGPGLIIPF